MGPSEFLTVSDVQKLNPKYELPSLKNSKFPRHSDAQGKLHQEFKTSCHHKLVQQKYT